MSLVEQHRKCDICDKELFGDELKVTLKRKRWFKIFAWFGNKPDEFFNYDLDICDYCFAEMQVYIKDKIKEKKNE